MCIRDRPYTPKGRKKAGKKGIGRVSVERLAEKVQIYSFPEFEPPYRVDINWNSFEEINIPALTQRIGILKDHQESTDAKFICNKLEYFMVTDKILQEDKDTVESILGTKSFEYPICYKNENMCIRDRCYSPLFILILRLLHRHLPRRIHPIGKNGRVFVSADIDEFLCGELRFLFHVRCVQSLGVQGLHRPNICRVLQSLRLRFFQEG